jgi:hypothetical protein
MKLNGAPPFVLRKLLQLNELTDALREEAAEAHRKADGLRVTLNTATLKPAELAQMRAELEAQLKLAPELKQRHSVEAAVLATCRRYVEQLPAHAALELAIVTTNGHDLASVRGRLAAIASETKALQDAPSPSSDIADRIRAYVSELGRKGAPLFHRGLSGDVPLDIRWPGTDANRFSGSGFDTTRANALLLTAWLQPDLLTERLLKEVEELAMQPLPVAERAGYLRQLAAEMRSLRYVEGALVARLLDAGEPVTRDASAPPQCVLQLRELAVEKEEAVA